MNSARASISSDMKLTLFSALTALALCLSVQAAEGSKAPEFKLMSQEGKAVDLKEFKGQWVVLYFYPKDMTTGCTIEAHNFQRDLAKYEAKKAAIIGVSAD